MPAVARRWISASTGDYEVASGGLRGDDGFTSKAVLALRTRKGSIPIYPEFGSSLHLVKYADERGRKLAEKYAFDAVAHLEPEVEELAVRASISTLQPGQIHIVVSGRRGSTTYTANYTAAVGGA
jgi:phage gp46-like protein